VANESLIVGYRSDDPDRFLTKRYNMGWTCERDGRCIECDRWVYLNPSGRTAHRERDSVLICKFCFEAGRQNRRSVEMGYL
jgi:hypothetical protein